MNGNDVIALLIQPIIDARQRKNNWYTLKDAIARIEHGAAPDWYNGREAVLAIVKFAQLMFENQADIAHTQAAITGKDVPEAMQHREWRGGVSGFAPKTTYIKLEVLLPDGKYHKLTVEDRDDNLLKALQSNDEWREQPYSNWTTELPD